MDEEVEVDEGKVTLVNYEEVDGRMVITDKKTNLWAWKHPRENGDYELVKLVGNVVFTNVDFSYNEKEPNPLRYQSLRRQGAKRWPLSVRQEQERPPLPT